MMTLYPSTTPTCLIFAHQQGPASAAAAPGLEDIWPQLHALLSHQRIARLDEEAMQAQQRGMVRDGCFLMPSPFLGRSGDLCCRSWSHEFQFYYEFDAGSNGTYFWISGLLDRGFSLDAIWFPDRHIAVSTYPTQLDAARLERFRQMLAGEPAKPAWSAPWIDVPRTAVVGFQHFMHMLWNELPALDRLADAGLPGTAQPGTFAIAIKHEPFGPMRELFPELAPWMQTLQHEDVPGWNAAHGLVLGLGSWSITPGTQDRVMRLATRHTGVETLNWQAAFRAAHGPVFWLSVKPPKRTPLDQPAMLAGLIQALRVEHPNAGFILDGASLPWDFPANTNYPPWFHIVSHTAVTASTVIISMVLAMLSSETREHIVSLNGISACEEATWGGLATFYVCHGGTMQNKIGWLHRIPGFIHSNLTFLGFARTMPPPVLNGPACYYASDRLIVDDDPSNYSSHDLARKDQNYSFASLGLFVEEVRAAFLAGG